MSNLVVQPQDWDERGKGVKTDRIDALALCGRLERYVRGNRKAFSVVRLPTGDEERERATSRQRGQLVRERQRLQGMGRSSLAMHGIHVTGKWWEGKTWTMVRREAPWRVVERLEVLIRLIEPVDAEERKLTEAIQEAGRWATGRGSTTAGRCRATPACVRANTAAGGDGGAGASTRAATRRCGRCWWRWCGG